MSSEKKPSNNLFYLSTTKQSGYPIKRLVPNGSRLFAPPFGRRARAARQGGPTLVRPDNPEGMGPKAVADTGRGRTSKQVMLALSHNEIVIHHDHKC